MKTSLRITLLMFLIIFFTETSFAEDYTFRKTKWGMSVAQVKASEPFTVAEEDTNKLIYQTKVINKDVALIYRFIDSQLVNSGYVLAEEHSNKNDFIEDYKDFKKILIKKYGEPKEDDKIWRDDLFKDDPSNWGNAISIGSLVYRSQWEIQDTLIALSLSGENYQIKVGVVYISKKLKSLVEKAKGKKALNEF
jgi:hypothetical protein